MESPESVESEGPAPLLIASRPRDLGGLEVRRVLPAPQKRSVGPFVFLDEMGPATFPVGEGMDVRPHPHIGLATLTYLFAGEVMHRDSLGTRMPILPGEVNLMTAGRGIVHSERIPESERKKGASLHGIQLWIALPKADEEIEPAFDHFSASQLPQFSLGSIDVTLIAGEGFAHRSPVQLYSPTIYASFRATEEGSFDLPRYDEVAIYVVDGLARVGEQAVDPGSMLILERRHDARSVQLTKGTRALAIGGNRFPEPRFLYWNFVSTSEERIEQAKEDWRNMRFATVPGDEKERIPLPQ